ncbi:MAG: chemotaxis response regulator protein-glutamate methylesterase [Pseudomonadota bacterium]
MSTVRVVVVDDSPTMRGLIIGHLQRDPSIEVVGTAGDPYEARQVIKASNPDVITLDIEMPKMDGLSFLEKIMRLRPMPVIMISTLTEKGAAISVEALQLGAVDCVCKPHGADMSDSFERLPELVKAAATARPRAAPASVSRSSENDGFVPDDKILAIGSSTGGVEALISVLSQFPANCPPTVVTQHMPKSFTASFAQRLDTLCAPHVKEAADGDPVTPGRIYIAPGGERHLEIAGAASPSCRLRDGDLVSGHRPSVDVLFRSVAKLAGDRAVGVILTGMGRDGADGLKVMHDAGARTIGQDEISCVVYGMPRVAYEIGAVERQLPLSQVAGTVLRLCDGRRRDRAA